MKRAATDEHSSLIRYQSRLHGVRDRSQRGSCPSRRHGVCHASHAAMLLDRGEANSSCTLSSDVLCSLLSFMTGHKFGRLPLKSCRVQLVSMLLSSIILRHLVFIIYWVLQPPSYFFASCAAFGMLHITPHAAERKTQRKMR